MANEIASFIDVLATLRKIEQVDSSSLLEFMRIVGELAQTDQVLSIVIIGSLAKGKFDELSDIDLFVIFREEQPDITTTTDKIKLIYFSDERVIRYTKKNYLFLKHIEESGIFLFDKDDFLTQTLSTLETKRSYVEEIDHLQKCFLILNFCQNKSGNYIYFLSLTYKLARLLLTYYYNTITEEEQIFSFDMTDIIDRLSGQSIKEKARQLYSLRIYDKIFKNDVGVNSVSTKLLHRDLDYLKSNIQLLKDFYTEIRHEVDG